jgi:hypothetical protein
MRQARADASRITEVRNAARAWRQSEAIDAATLGAIEEAYPSGRAPLSRAWIILIFVLVTVAIHALFFAAARLSGGDGGSFRWLFFGGILVAATEFLTRSRFAGNGSDAATSFWACVYGIVGSGLLLRSTPRGLDGALTLALLVASVSFTAACWRWGYEAYGGIGAAALFLLLARFPGARLTWILAGTAVVAVAARRLDRAALAPPHRRGFAAALAVSAIALYAAVNRFSLDRGMIETLGSSSPPAPASAAARGLANALTALLPLVLVAWGIRARRLLVLNVGIALGALSLATLREYVPLAPPWAWLLVGGAALVFGALALNRALRRAPGAERRGFTALPLYGAKRGEGLQAAAILVGFTPGARAPADPGKLSPGGGRYGGGGATGSI